MIFKNYIMHISTKCTAGNITVTQKIIEWRPLLSFSLAPAGHLETGNQPWGSGQIISPLKMPNSKRLPQSKLETHRKLTAEGPPRGPWPRRCLSSISLHLAPKHQFQLLGIWRRDGIPPNCHLNQREPHTPNVRLHRVVSPLESFWLQKRQTQLSSV